MFGSVKKKKKTLLSFRGGRKRIHEGSEPCIDEVNTVNDISILFQAVNTCLQGIKFLRYNVFLSSLYSLL